MCIYRVVLQRYISREHLYHLYCSNYHSHFGMYIFQGFIQDFQFGGGDVVCGLTGMGEYFSQVTPRNAKSIVVSFADK